MNAQEERSAKLDAETDEGDHHSGIASRMIVVEDGAAHDAAEIQVSEPAREKIQGSRDGDGPAGAGRQGLDAARPHLSEDFVHVGLAAVGEHDEGDAAQHFVVHDPRIEIVGDVRRGHLVVGDGVADDDEDEVGDGDDAEERGEAERVELLLQRHRKHDDEPDADRHEAGAPVAGEGLADVGFGNVCGLQDGGEDLDHGDDVGDAGAPVEGDHDEGRAAVPETAEEVTREILERRESGAALRDTEESDAVHGEKTEDDEKHRALDVAAKSERLWKREETSADSAGGEVEHARADTAVSNEFLEELTKTASCHRRRNVIDFIGFVRSMFVFMIMMMMMIPVIVIFEAKSDSRPSSFTKCRNEGSVAVLSAGEVGFRLR